MNFFILATLMMFTAPSAYAVADKKVSLIIYLDFSPSMTKHIRKVADLIPMMTERLERTCGNYQIATSNILYRNHNFNNLTPYGIPAFITPETPRAQERIANRLRAPFGNNTSEMIELDGYYLVTSSTEEITYSSIVASIEHNQSSLQNQDLVAALIVTDAVPAFENETPDSALQKIETLLPGTQFLAMAVGMKMFNGMPKVLAPNCRPDFTGTPQNPHIDLLSTEGWINPNLSSLEQFTRQSGGWVADICEDSYDSTLQDFIQTIILNAGCMQLM